MCFLRTLALKVEPEDPNGNSPQTVEEHVQLQVHLSGGQWDVWTVTVP